MTSLIADLCREHAAWAVDATEFDELPVGWHGLVAELFRALGAVMAGRPGQRIEFAQIKEKMGSLRVYLGPMGNGATPEEVRILIAEAEDRSARTCDACGGPGVLRCDAGWLSTRCDAHVKAAFSPVAAAAPVPVGAPEPPSSDAPETVGAGLDARHRPSHSRAGGWQHRAGKAPPWCLPLYALSDVSAALGRRRGGAAAIDDGFQGNPEEREPPPPPPADNEHQARLQEILAAGALDRWRDLAAVPPGAFEALDDLGRRAPHLDAVTSLVRRHLRASVAIGLPVALPPLLLIGEPGVGKTWYLSRLAGVLGVPFRSYPFNTSTLGEGLSGSHPSWRNSGPGLVAKTLLRERKANPLLFVDEVDKAPANGWNRDPYGPLYSLLDPSNAKAFTDEYLQFAMDASATPCDVVVTHHLPSARSVHPRFAGDPLTPAFASDLDDLVARRAPALWVHGHTHYSCDYRIGATRILCNPHGYGGENPDYDPALVVEVIRSGGRADA